MPMMLYKRYIYPLLVWLGWASSAVPEVNPGLPKTLTEWNRRKHSVPIDPHRPNPQVERSFTLWGIAVLVWAICSLLWRRDKDAN